MKIKDILSEFAKEHKNYLIGYFFLSFANPIIRVVVPHYYGKIISKLPKGEPIQSDVIKTFAFLILVQLCYAMINKLDVTFIPKLQTFIRQKMIKGILDTHKEDYKELEIGEILANIIGLPVVIREIFFQIRSSFLPLILVTIATFAYLYWVHPELGVIFLIGLITSLMLMKGYFSDCVSSSESSEKVSNKLHEEIADTLNNILQIYTAGKDSAELDRLKKIEDQFNVEYSKSIKDVSHFRRLFDGIQVGILILLNWYSYRLFTQDKIGVDSFSSVLFITSNFVNYWRTVISETREFAHGLGVLFQTQGYLDTFVEILKKKDILLNNFAINIKNLKVRNLDIPQLTIPENDSLVVLGHIGSGKTTLVQSILNMIKYSGDIYLGNTNVKDINANDLRKIISYIPQSPKLFNRSLYENIGYSGEIDKQLIEQQLNELGVNLGDLNRLAGKGGSNVSGGQRQIIAILQALFSKNSKIVILDEPTSALDPKTKEIVIKLIKELGKNRTLIIITHDSETSSLGKSILKL